MNSLEWSFVDKSEWPRGPWDAEPDKMQWTDEATGLPCLVHRNRHSGALCGYVGVTEEHAWFAISHDDVPFGGTDAHGGLTYSDFCKPTLGGDGSGPGICHVPEPGDPEIWWFGFDCAHAFDLMPGLQLPPFDDADEYRDLAYVRAECARLAAQLARVA